MAQNSVCSLCEQEFKSVIAMKNHICKEEDCKHKLMAYVYKSENVKIKCGEINSYIEKYKDFFYKVTEDNLETMQKSLVEKILADIREEKENKRLEKLEEKRQKELQKQLDNIQRLKELEEERNLRKSVEQAQFKKMNKEDRPKSLLDEYYDLVQSNCYQYMVEIQLVKGLYTKYNFNAETAHFIIRYLAKMRIPLKNINYKIEEALKFKQGLEDSKIEGTIPFLIKYFYQKTKQKRNNKLFVREIDRLTSSQEVNGLTYEQIKNVLDGMIKKDVKNLAFFDSYVSEFANSKILTEDPIHNFTDEREIKENVKQILKGNLTLDDVNKKIHNQCAQILRNIYLKGEFNSNYNYFEWAYKVKLPLDKELYAFGQKHRSERNDRFVNWYNQILQHSNNADLLKRYQQAKLKFNNWLSSFE